jgi:hypothetical protein
MRFVRFFSHEVPHLGLVHGEAMSAEAEGIGVLETTITAK